MAIYHCQVKPVSRAKGHSSTAGAAYRSCSKIHDERTGELHDYRRKRGLEHCEIVLSSDAEREEIQWARDRERLWNAAEAAEVRRDGRPAREYEVALPHELDQTQRRTLAREFASELADRYQCAVDVAIHKPHSRGDKRNFHAHLYATTRQVTADGLGDKTLIERSDADRRKLGLGPGKDEIAMIREQWGRCANRALENAQRHERVDHRSLEAQGIDRAPTSHRGPAVCALESSGRFSVVLERMRDQEANVRFESSAELGRIERQERELRREILELSEDGAADPGGRKAGHGSESDRAGVARRAVDNWLAHKEAEARRHGLVHPSGLDNRFEPTEPANADRGRSRRGPEVDFER